MVDSEAIMKAVMETTIYRVKATVLPMRETSDDSRMPTTNTSKANST